MRYIVNYDFENMLENLFGHEKQDRSRQLPVDIRESQDAYLIEAELPGFSREEIEVGVEDMVLTISAKKAEAEKEDATPQQEAPRYIVRERRGSGYHRRFSLPRDVDVDKISADYQNGILSLEIPKSEEAKPRSIKVKAA